MQLVGDKLYPCMVTAHATYSNAFFGTKLFVRQGDYIEINKIKSDKDIWRLLYRTQPFCMFHKRTFFNESESISKKILNEWSNYSEHDKC